MHIKAVLIFMKILPTNALIIAMKAGIALIEHAMTYNH